MNERQAEQQGMMFTGVYGRDKEEVKEKAKEYKKTGYKVVICTVPDSKLSRGPKGIGYSLYAEKKYFIDRDIKQHEKELSLIEDKRKAALENYKKELIKIDERELYLKNEVKQLKEELGNITE